MLYYLVLKLSIWILPPPLLWIHLNNSRYSAAKYSPGNSDLLSGSRVWLITSSSYLELGGLLSYPHISPGINGDTLSKSDRQVTSLPLCSLCFQLGNTSCLFQGSLQFLLLDGWNTVCGENAVQCSVQSAVTDTVKGDFSFFYLSELYMYCKCILKGDFLEIWYCDKSMYPPLAILILVVIPSICKGK